MADLPWWARSRLRPGDDGCVAEHTLCGLFAQKDQYGGFTVHIVDDDGGVEPVHGRRHTWWQLAVGFIPAPLDVRDHLLDVMGPGQPRFFPDHQTLRGRHEG